MDPGGMLIQNLDRSSFQLRRIITLTLIIQQVTRLRRIIHEAGQVMLGKHHSSTLSCNLCDLFANGY